MSIETLFKEFTRLPESEQKSFLANALSHLYGEAAPNWAEEMTKAITEEEWQAMEAELEGVKNGSIKALPLQEFVASLK
ncbi:MAG: hypothetical protein H6573_09385 [Lewinellaceae bacterium]|nr:hypothetical protein [Phaeodactylibacter sp.]MCB0615461.1 hypothetical protein [Phaeodactylibacter sp.]MCB9347707.1 hypothetical protein [Lewinellaceae bacterium]